MKHSGALKSIVGVTISNIILVLSGIFVGFVIPKILSVEGYGYYKTFTLYTTYLSLCHLGIIDGIVLKYGGNDYEDLDRTHFRSVFLWYCLINLLFSLIFMIIAYQCSDINISFIVLFLGLNVLAINVLGYFQQISQITQRFKEYSARRIIQGVANVLIVAILLLTMTHSNSVIDYKAYIFWIVVENYILSLWYVITYKDIIFGKRDILKDTFPSVLRYIKTGTPLLIANMCATLILTLDRQFVNVLFDVTTYAVYSFAYNMLSLVTVATSAVSTVLYPTMKRSTEAELVDKLDFFVRIMLVFVFGTMTLYFPLVFIINWFLPKYTDSLPIFRIIFAGLPISSAVTVVIHNYYKVFGRSTSYFFKSAIILLISGLANVMAYLVFKTTTSISIASVAVLLGWFICTEWYFVRKYNLKYKKTLTYILIMMFTFYEITAIDGGLVGLVLYVLAFTLLSAAFFSKDIRQLIGLIK